MNGSEAYFFGIVDQVIQDLPTTPDSFTGRCFDHYISLRGIPKTANEARVLFEYAAVCELIAHDLGERGVVL